MLTMVSLSIFTSSAVAWPTTKYYHVMANLARNFGTTARGVEVQQWNSTQGTKTAWTNNYSTAHFYGTLKGNNAYRWRRSARQAWSIWQSQYVYSPYSSEYLFYMYVNAPW